MISRLEVREFFGRAGSRLVRPKIQVTADEAAALLQGIVAVNLRQMGKQRASLGGDGAFPILRGIQQGTVRYERLDPDEEWKTWGQLRNELAATGRATGDCEDLASAVSAELTFAGIEARPYVYKAAPSLYHVVVKTNRWGLMDPSRAAGMEGDG